jgi:F-type H+-transporting ATPase subunit b
MVSRNLRYVVRLTAGALVFAPGVALADTMPQLNFANPLTALQAVWLLVIFLGLYVLLKDWGLPQVARVVDARNASIRQDLDTAQAAKQRAEAAVVEMHQTIARARAAAQARIAEEVARAKAEAAARAAEANQALEARLTEAEAQIAEARNAAMGALRQVAAETTDSVVTRLLGIPPAAGAVNQAVDRALAARAA